MSGRSASQAVFGDDVVRQELETVMPVIASTLVQATGTDSCAFYVYDETASRTVAAFRYGYSQVIFPALADNDTLSPHSVPIEAELLRTRRTIRRFTEDDFRRWPMHNDVLRERAQRYSDIAVPLVWNEDVLGVAYLWRRGVTTPFNDHEIAVAEDLAQIAAMAVVFARQYGRERSQRERLDALLAVASIAGSALTVEAVLQNVARAVRRSSGADVCGLYVFDESGERVADMFTDAEDEHARRYVPRSVADAVSDVPVETRLRETLAAELVSDFEQKLAPGADPGERAREMGVRQILVVPIVYQREMIGAIYTWHLDPRQYFSEDAIQTIQAIASQAGGIISRARLDEASRQHVQETEALLGIGRAVLTGNSLSSVLDEVARSLAASIQYDYAYVAMLDSSGRFATITHTWGPFPETVTNQTLPLDGSLTGWAIRTGELVNVADAHADERNFRFKPQYIPIRSAMIAPLVTEQGTIGALYLGRTTGGGFTMRQERLMSLLSQQAALAVERTEAREALARRGRRQTLLARVADRLASADDLEDALTEIVRSVAGVLAQGAAISLSSWEYGHTSWAAMSVGNESDSARLSRLLNEIDLSSYRDDIEHLLLGDTPVAVSVEECPWMAGAPEEEYRELGIAGKLVIPMRSRDRAPGLLFLFTSGDPHSFPPDVVETAELVASRIGDEIERRKMSRNRAALLRASEGMNRHTDLDELVSLIARELNEIIPYDSLYIGAHDRESGMTQPLYFLNPLGYPMNDIEMASNQGISGYVMRTQTPVLSNEAHEHPATVYISESEESYYDTYGESVMAAPLSAEDEVVGVLFVGRTGAHRFHTSDFEAFKLFVGLSASAIHRAMLLQRNRSIYRASVEVLAAIVDAHDPSALQHSRNVARYARACSELLELNAECIETIELAGLLHDIGKLALPDDQAEALDRVEVNSRRPLNDHPLHGAEILRQHPVLCDLAPLVHHHHEWYDGGGFPDRLAADAIPLGARIIAVADVFDWVNSASSSARAGGIDAAVESLQQSAGTRLDPGIVKLFVEAVWSGTIDLNARGEGTIADDAIQAMADVSMHEVRNIEPASRQD